MVIILIAHGLLHILLDRMTGVHDIYHIVNGWQALELVLHHLLELGFFTKNSLEECIDVFHL